MSKLACSLLVKYFMEDTGCFFRCTVSGFDVMETSFLQLTDKYCVQMSHCDLGFQGHEYGMYDFTL